MRVLCGAIQASAAASVSKLLTVVGWYPGPKPLHRTRQKDIIGRLGVCTGSRVRLAIELVFANHALSPIDDALYLEAQRAASTTLANAMSKLPPMVLTMRPPCSLIFGSTSSRLTALSAARVPSSSAPISRDTPPHRRRGSRRDAGQWAWLVRRRRWLNQVYPETCGSPTIEIVGVSRVGRIRIVAGSRKIAGQHPGKAVKIGQEVKQVGCRPGCVGVPYPPASR
jgi:hypothetical protein